ncbi:MAG: hypothetical protein TRG1_3538 [Flavobacteriaceae bacterium FS1-H7996/R]|nr:MAG: hypothetical protein TRG1_3538 [Flavobacteriaceae bacterium FS1-H7996/R]
MLTVIVAFLSPKQDNKVGVPVTVAFIGVGTTSVTGTDASQSLLSLTFTI